MCFQDDAPDTKKDFTGDPRQDKSLPWDWECCPSFHLSSYSPPSPFISFTKKETGVFWCARDSLADCRNHTVHESIRSAAHSQEGFAFTACTLFFWPPAEMMRWNSNGPDCCWWWWWGETGGGCREYWAFWQRLQRRPDTSGSGRFGLLCTCPGLWCLFPGTWPLCWTNGWSRCPWDLPSPSYSCRWLRFIQSIFPLYNIFSLFLLPLPLHFSLYLFLIYFLGNK